MKKYQMVKVMINEYKDDEEKESLDDEEKESFKQELFRKERQEQRIRREITEALAKEEKQGKKNEKHAIITCIGSA